MGWFTAAVGIVGGIMGRKAGKDAAKDARRASAANARNIELEVEEDLRRMDRQQDFRMGSARANLYSSGVTGTGLSAQSVTQSLEDEFAEQRDFTVRSGKSRADAARKGGAGTGDAARLAGGLSIATGLSSVAENWWG